ncbi:MAG: hypothetical protein Q9M91_01705 [Candidatus Dojkabacteria bacterium]|nr:hypothetical protein [Candidatus Dojkabacteria bacterium]MDQ7020539.1 hypothetical protein [Candidatus Dojkabacteria bacterium]
MLGPIIGTLVALIVPLLQGDWGGAVITLIAAFITFGIFGVIFYSIFKPIMEQKKLLIDHPQKAKYWK